MYQMNNKQGGSHLVLLLCVSCIALLSSLALVVVVDAKITPATTTTSTVSGSNLTGCDQPFGGIIGVSHGVKAYSNCNSSYTSNMNHFHNITNKTSSASHHHQKKDEKEIQVFTGMQWQCVEYARRFLLEKRGVVFGSVVGATDIWNLTHVTSPLLGKNQSQIIKFVGYPNGITTMLPQVGDLIIYPVQPRGMPFGHVAVIVDVTAKQIHVGEQNWSSHLWPNINSNYSRALNYTTISTSTGSMVVNVTDTDGYILDGWKRAMVIPPH